MTNTERALDLFSRQFNCAQAVLAALGPAEGLTEHDCLRIAAPFGGGIGRLGETCGAVTGAIMAIGLRYGAAAARDPETKTALYERVRDFVARFKARHGSIICRDLLGCDLGTPEGVQQAKVRDTHHTVCTALVRSAIELAGAV